MERLSKSQFSSCVTIKRRLEIYAPEELSEEEKEIYEEEHNLSNNYKFAFMELFIKNNNL